MLRWINHVLDITRDEQRMQRHTARANCHLTAKIITRSSALISPNVNNSQMEDPTVAEWRLTKATAGVRGVHLLAYGVCTLSAITERGQIQFGTDAVSIRFRRRRMHRARQTDDQTLIDRHTDRNGRTDRYRLFTYRSVQLVFRGERENSGVNRWRTDGEWFITSRRCED